MHCEGRGEADKLEKCHAGYILYVADSLASYGGLG